MRKFLALFIGAPLLAVSLTACHGGPHRQDLLTSDAEIDANVPTSGSLFTGMQTECNSGTTMPDSQSAADNAWQDSKADTNMLACAVLAVRLDEGVNNSLAATYRDRVVAGLHAYEAEGANQVKVLGTARSMSAIVEAADLVDYYDAALKLVLVDQLTKTHNVGVCANTLVGVAHCSGENWGDNARGSIVAMYRYLDGWSDLDYSSQLATEAAIFKEYTGETTTGPVSLNYSDGTAWRPSGADPRGINARSWRICSGNLDVSGVRSNDQARGGNPNCSTNEAGQVNENYAYGGFQGNVIEWIHLIRAGLVSNTVGDQAVVRALEWLNSKNAFPPEPDDAWVIPAVNSFGGLGGFSFAEQPCDAGSPGKVMSCNVAKALW